MLMMILLLLAPFSHSLKKPILTPFQTNLQNCLGKNFDVQNIDSSKKLYKAIELIYPLSTSETIYREVLYTQKNELKKLKYENGIIQIFKILDEDDSVTLMSSEKFGEKKEDYQMRHKIKSVDGRINQLLFRADIKSDFQRIKETRALQLVLNVVWSDSKIKSLDIEFLKDKKTLSCIQKELVDICNCRS